MLILRGSHYRSRRQHNVSRMAQIDVRTSIHGSLYLFSSDLYVVKTREDFVLKGYSFPRTKTYSI
jgi:hypothetical protein